MHLGYFLIIQRRGGGASASEPLENRQSGGGQSTGIDILSVRGSVQGRFWGTAVYLREGMLEKLNGGQDLKIKCIKERKWRLVERNIQLEVYNYQETQAHLREERPLVLGLLDAVGHQPFHGFGAVLVELTEVWRQIASSHHVDDLREGRGGHRWQIRLILWNTDHIWKKNILVKISIQCNSKRHLINFLISSPPQRWDSFFNMCLWVAGI